jgi:hypothetical protein
MFFGKIVAYNGDNADISEIAGGNAEIGGGSTQYVVFAAKGAFD